MDVKDERDMEGFAAAVRALREGGASAFAPGDTVMAQHALIGRMGFVVLGVDVDPVPGVAHTLSLMASHAQMAFPFDAATPEHPVGCSDWATSSAREALNGAFLRGFSPADRAVMLPTARRTYSFENEAYVPTQDWAFLLSASEAGYAVDGQQVMDEGAAYPLFAHGMTHRVTDESDRGRRWFLRSAKGRYADAVRVIHPIDALTYCAPNCAYTIVPACVLGTTGGEQTPPRRRRRREP